MDTNPQELEYALAVADRWVSTVETHRRIFGREELVRSLAELIVKERSVARSGGWDMAMDVAAAVADRNDQSPRGVAQDLRSRKGKLLKP